MKKRHLYLNWIPLAIWYGLNVCFLLQIYKTNCNQIAFVFFLTNLLLQPWRVLFVVVGKIIQMLVLMEWRLQMSQFIEYILCQKWETVFWAGHLVDESTLGFTFKEYIVMVGDFVVICLIDFYVCTYCGISVWRLLFCFFLPWNTFKGTHFNSSLVCDSGTKLNGSQIQARTHIDHVNKYANQDRFDVMWTAEHRRSDSSRSLRFEQTTLATIRIYFEEKNDFLSSELARTKPIPTYTLIFNLNWSVST